MKMLRNSPMLQCTLVSMKYDVFLRGLLHYRFVAEKLRATRGFTVILCCQQTFILCSQSTNCTTVPFKKTRVFAFLLSKVKVVGEGINYI